MVKYFFTLFLFLLLSGCSGNIQDRNLVSASYKAADELLDNSREIHLYPNKPILVASFVDIDNVQRSSTLGRIIAEQIGSRLVQQGYKIVEVKLRTSSIFVRGVRNEDEGEFLLSRELQDISLQHDAHAVVVGTYAKGREQAYVTAKLVRTKDSIILSSYDYSLPLGPNTKSLLRN